MEWKWLIAPGSIFVIAPMALLLGFLLARKPENRRAVRYWWFLFSAACALTAASKIAHYAWGTQIARWNMTCFSGHAMLAFAFWPLFFALLSSGKSKVAQHFFTLLGVVLAAVISFSRIELRAHPLSEVIAGSVLGIAVSFLGGRQLAQTTLSMATRALLVGFLGALLITETYQSSWTRQCTEPLFAWIAAYMENRPLPLVPCLQR